MSAQIGDDRRIAVERIRRIARITQRLEPHRAGIQHHQPADQTLAKTDDFADRFQRHHRTQNARKRAHHAGFGESLVGRLVMVDARAMRFETLRYARDPANPLNGDTPTITDLSGYAA